VPPYPALAADQMPGSFMRYFERYAFNLEAYGFFDAAVRMYLGALRYRDEPNDALRPLVVGAIRASIAGHRTAQALDILDQAERGGIGAPAAYWRQLRSRLSRAQPDSSSADPRSP